MIVLTVCSRIRRVCSMLIAAHFRHEQDLRRDRQYVPRLDFLIADIDDFDSHRSYHTAPHREFIETALHETFVLISPRRTVASTSTTSSSRSSRAYSATRSAGGLCSSRRPSACSFSGSFRRSASGCTRKRVTSPLRTPSLP